jgi:hypothetical protein
VLRPGLDHPPGWGEGDLDISAMPGVPGIVGRPSPRVRPERPLVVPSLLRDSAISGRVMLDGACLAADERLLRWPEEVEASVTSSASMGYEGCGRRTCAARSDTEPVRWDRRWCSDAGIWYYRTAGGSARKVEAKRWRGETSNRGCP